MGFDDEFIGTTFYNLFLQLKPYMNKVIKKIDEPRMCRCMYYYDEKNPDEVGETIWTEEEGLFVSYGELDSDN